MNTKPVSSKRLSVISIQLSVVSRWNVLIFVLLCVGLFGFGLTSTVWAQNTPGGGDVSVRISKESAAAMAGDWVDFTTVLTNEGTAATPPLAAHLSIAGIRDGMRHIDPEDWLRQRTQYLPPLQPGESVELAWKLHVLFEGEFTSFVTVVSSDKSFVPTTSAPLRLQVTPDNILPLKDVLPVAAVVPFFPLGLLFFSGAYARRRR